MRRGDHPAARTDQISKILRSRIAQDRRGGPVPYDRTPPKPAAFPERSTRLFPFERSEKGLRDVCGKDWPPRKAHKNAYVTVDTICSMCYSDIQEVREMARVVIAGFPDDLYHELKVKAALDKTTVKALLIGAAEKIVGRTGKDRLSESSEALLNKHTPRKVGGK